jgi:two-component system, LuxR family, response regulator FixJ
VPHTKKTIIVVDDDEAVRESLKFSLELDGLTVHAFDGAESLLRYPGLKKAACLVLDNRMPDTDGFALRKKLAARGLSMPLILITAPVSSELHRRARNAGFFAVLEKPLLGNVLLENVHAAIGN